MKRYRCSTCGGICDPGELKSGVCFDCREAEERAGKTSGAVPPLHRFPVKVREQADGQMVLEVT